MKKNVVTKEEFRETMRGRVFCEDCRHSKNMSTEDHIWYKCWHPENVGIEWLPDSGHLVFWQEEIVPSYEKNRNNNCGQWQPKQGVWKKLKTFVWRTLNLRITA